MQLRDLTPCLILAVFAALVGLTVGYCQGKRIPARSPVPDVIQLQQTPRFERYDYVDIPLVVSVPDVPEQELRELAEKYDLPDLGSPVGEIVGPVVLREFTVPPLPWGGEALVYRAPEGLVEQRVVPSPRPSIAWRPRFEPEIGLTSKLDPFAGVAFSPGHVWTGAEPVLRVFYLEDRSTAALTLRWRF